MATNQHETLARVRELLRAGKVQEADDCVTTAMAAAVASGAAPAPAASEPAPPRPPLVVVSDLLHKIVAHLGAHPELEKVLAEFDTVLQEL